MQITTLLKEQFDISKTDLESALRYQRKFNGRLEQILVNMGSLPTDQLPAFYCALLDLPILDISQWLNTDTPDVDAETLNKLIKLNWVPLKTSEQSWEFACEYPLEPEINEWISKQNFSPKVYVASDADLQVLINKFNTGEHNDFLGDYGDEQDRLIELASETPTINLLNSLIIRALKQGASDMHLEPNEGRYRARYRVDGVLHEVEKIPPKMEQAVVARLKILSGMDIAEKRRPQDGKIGMKIAGEELDIRVSALPLNDGESMVMRFLRKESVRYDMSVLGLSNDIRELIDRDLQSTAGVILLTGPTGSGKTTTLYTFLNSLNNDDVKIVTLEDPVEYQLEGVNQVQVNSDIGFDFAAGLRSIVRQDPDIIMLGEIRDKETAQIALQSALTGHLVFSTVHTNDAASAYTRLLDLGVEEFLLNAALVSVVAQRLVRKVCEDCAQPDPESAEMIEKYELNAIAEKFGIEKISLKRGVGCESCSNTGYRGRMAVTQYLACDEFIKSQPKDSNFIASANQHNSELKRRTLMEDGLYKAILGQTTIDEVIRVAG